MTGWNPEATQRAYDAVADVYADHFPSTETEQPFELALIDAFADAVAEPKRVLDAGCGAGRMLPYVAALGCSVSGVDLSPEMIRRAQHDHPNYDTRVGSLLALPFPDSSFDGVLCWYSLIHLTDAELPAAFGECRRVLVPDGLLLTGFQVGAAPREVGAGFRRRGFDVELMRFHRSVAEVSAVAERLGLAVVDAAERPAAGGEADGQAVVLLRALS